jgi:hypothetical protein
MVLFFLAFVSAVGLAWALTPRFRTHRPIAVLLSVGLGAELAQGALDAAVLSPLRSSLGVDVPWTGWAWAASLLDNGLALLWPAAIVSTALVVFLDRKPWLGVVALAAALLVFAEVHPIAGDGGQARFLASVEALAAIASAGMAVTWYRHNEGPAPAQHVLAAIVLTEILTLPPALRVVAPQHWPPAQTLYLVMVGVLVALQAYAIAQRMEQRLDAADKGVLRSTIIAAAAVRAAERAEEKATEARDLADNIPAAPPPSSRRPSPTPQLADTIEAPHLTNGAPPSSRRGSTPTPT